MPTKESFEWKEIARAHREATVRRMVEYGGTIKHWTQGKNYAMLLGNRSNSHG
jgi:hypothetical protein